MARIFITGSADGLGLLAAKKLVAEGHKVVVHGRNDRRANDALKSVPGAETTVSGDLSLMSEIKQLADKVNKLGEFDAIIHNAGIGSSERNRIVTTEGLSQLFAVNTMAPYILTCLLQRPKRLIYLSSGLHRSGDASLNDLNWENRTWNGYRAYSDTKLHDVLLAFAAARKWKDVLSNAMEPGWVPTKMGGPGAPDSLEEGVATQVWLAASIEKSALVSGQYFYHKRLYKTHPEAASTQIQDKLILECERISGIRFPDGLHIKSV